MTNTSPTVGKIKAGSIPDTTPKQSEPEIDEKELESIVRHFLEVEVADIIKEIVGIAGKDDDGNAANKAGSIPDTTPKQSEPEIDEKELESVVQRFLEVEVADIIKEIEKEIEEAIEEAMEKL